MGTMKLISILLFACKTSATVSALECPCPCPVDAQEVDADIDVPPSAIDLSTPWHREFVTPSSPLFGLRGADGVARDTEGCHVTGWEQSGAVTRACPVGSGWIVETVADGLSGVEDCKPGNMDADGAIDVVCGLDVADGRVVIAFRGESEALTTLTASMGHGRVMQVAVVDVDGDGDPDIIFGTRVGTPAVVGWLRNPGGSEARLSVHWNYQQISSAGWVMSLVPGDRNGDGRMDVVVSDRTKLSDGTWGMYGVRWSEQMADGTWASHAISPPAGSCSPYSSTTCARTPGDQMMISVAGNAVYACTSLSSQVDSRVSIYTTADWLTWTHQLLPAAVNVGHCQHVAPMDVDADGDTDVVVSAWKGGAYPVPEPDASRSGVYWLRAPEWSRGEISGPVGGKFDNLAIDGACVVTSEQLDPEGGLGVVRYCP